MARSTGKGGKKQQGGNKGQNRSKSNNFLEKNRKKPEVMVTESGLQYVILEDTTGPKPQTNDRVRVDQRAWLIGGKMLDDTYKEGVPLEFSLKEVIDGYQEGLMLMGTGSKYRFFIPPELGWGEKGSGGRIGPNAVVIFEVRLLKIL